MEQTKHGISVKRRIYSFPMKGESRAEAICRSFRQYTLVDWAKYNKVSIPISSDDKIKLLDMLHGLWFDVYKVFQEK